jgi:thiamine pyrophosphate-dependent acetolactate synthase large subunit-like protein
VTPLRHEPHGGDRVAAALQAHGVPASSRCAAGTSRPSSAAAKARGMRIVDVRDEATAVFAADAAARLTGRPAWPR